MHAQVLAVKRAMTSGTNHMVPRRSTAPHISRVFTDSTSQLLYDNPYQMLCASLKLTVTVVDAKERARQNNPVLNHQEQSESRCAIGQSEHCGLSGLAGRDGYKYPQPVII